MEGRINLENSKINECNGENSEIDECNGENKYCT